jgi:hypothetical protein
VVVVMMMMMMVMMMKMDMRVAVMDTGRHAGTQAGR